MENYFLRDEEKSIWDSEPEPAWCRRWEQNREKPSRAFIGCWQMNGPPGGSAIKPVNLGLSGKKNFLELVVVPKIGSCLLYPKADSGLWGKGVGGWGFCIALLSAF